MHAAGMDTSGFVGIDGVGHLDDGRRVYFVLPKAPFGSMSEKTVILPSQCVSLPDDLDDVTAAAIANPGTSAWAAFKERAKLTAGETVLVNGATGTAGRLAVQIAKYMGARKIVATGRNAEALKALSALGADVTIPVGDGGDAFEDALKQRFGGDGIDVVLDYLWGQSAERIIIAGAQAGRDAVPIRFVHIGAVSAPNITLPSATTSFFGYHAHGKWHRQHPNGQHGEINRRIDADNCIRRLRNRDQSCSTLRS
jgi:NADPH:quinone reductase-like Zn-dependent oxidoreductase